MLASLIRDDERKGAGRDSGAERSLVLRPALRALAHGDRTDRHHPSRLRRTSYFDPRLDDSDLTAFRVGRDTTTSGSAVRRLPLLTDPARRHSPTRLRQRPPTCSSPCCQASVHLRPGSTTPDAAAVPQANRDTDAPSILRAVDNLQPRSTVSVATFGSPSAASAAAINAMQRISRLSSARPLS